jgi:hypothetical protein
MSNGKINICLGAIMVLIHPKLDGNLEGLQVMLQNPLLPSNDGLHSTSDVLDAMRKQFLFIVIDELHGSTTTKARSQTMDHGRSWERETNGK